MTLGRTQATSTAVPSVTKLHMLGRPAWVSVTPWNPGQHTRHLDLLLAAPLQQRLAACRGTSQHCFQRGHAPDQCWPEAPVLKK